MSGIGNGVRWAAVTIVALMTMNSASLAAQSYDPRNPGLTMHFQVGFTWSTLTDVSPTTPPVTYENRRSPALALRATYLLGQTPVAGFLEVASAQRGATLERTDAASDVIRSRWYDASSGLNFALRCVYGICPSVEAGGVLGYHRETLRVSGMSGTPVEVIPNNRWELAALGGVRFAVQRLRGAAIVVRRVEGLSQLPTDETTARNRSTSLLFSLPLGR